MCWKQEWSHAINNLTRAMVHIQKARDKLGIHAHERLETERRALTKGRQDIVKDAREKADKTLEAIGLCNRQMHSLEETRFKLLDLIKIYGISQSKYTEDVKWIRLIGKCTLCESVVLAMGHVCYGCEYCGVENK